MSKSYFDVEDLGRYIAYGRLCGSNEESYVYQSNFTKSLSVHAQGSLEE